MARWLPGFDVEGAVARLADTMIVDAAGGFGGFRGLAFDYAVALLEGHALLDDELLPDERLDVVRRACFAAARRGELTVRRFSGELSREQNALLARPVESFRVIADVSVAPSITMRRLTYRGAVHVLHPRLTAAARTARAAVLETFRHNVLGEPPTDYSTLSVSVRARESRALEDGNRRLDLLRALWNLGAHGHSRRLSHGRAQPVNVVGFGPVYTLHRPTGTPDDRMALIDSRYRAPVPSLVDPDRFARLDAFARRALDLLRRVPYAAALEREIVRYGHALDSRELDSTLVELWSVLERLTGTERADYDGLIRRASFQFEHPEAVRQVLLHIRRRRNAQIHEGHGSATVEMLVYLLKDVVERTLGLHLVEGHRFDGIAEFAHVLDAPADAPGRAARSEALDSERRILELARKLRSRHAPRLR